MHVNIYSAYLYQAFLTTPKCHHITIVTYIVQDEKGKEEKAKSDAQFHPILFQINQQKYSTEVFPHQTNNHTAKLLDTSPQNW